MILAYYRSKVLRGFTTNGAMLAASLGAGAASQYIEPSQGRVVIACHNSPASVTLSGDTDALVKIQGQLSAQGVFVRLVNTNGKAYHSPHMAPLSDEYEELVRHEMLELPPMARIAGSRRMVSTVKNAVLPENSVLDEQYWSTNLLSPVLFNQAIQTLKNDSLFADVDLFIEIGPHSTLSGPIRQIRYEFGYTKLDYLPSLIRNQNSAVSLLKLAGELFLRNYPVSMDSITAHEDTFSTYGKVVRKDGKLIVDLPPYQWNENKKYWAEGRQSREQRAPQFPRHDVLGSLVPGCSKISPIWRNVLRIRDLSWLKDHSLGGEAVFPAAGYFAMAMEAITQSNETSDSPVNIEGYILKDVTIRKALVTPDDDSGIEVQLIMHPSPHARTENVIRSWDFQVTSTVGDQQAEEHMSGTISISSQSERTYTGLTPHLPQRSSGKAWYQALRAVGFDYGPTFQDMENIQFDGKTYVATCDTRIKNNVAGMSGESRYVLHPAMIDLCLQLLIVSNFTGLTSKMPAGAVLISVEEVTIWTPNKAQLANFNAKAHSWIDPRGARTFVGHNRLVGSDGGILMEFKNMRCVLYEACLPATTAEPSIEEPFGQMVWRLDIDELSEPEEMDTLHYLELLIFKNPSCKVVAIGVERVRSLLEAIPVLNITVMVDTEDEVDLAKELLSSYENTHVKLLDSHQESESSQPDLFDVVISSDRSVKHLEEMRRLLKANGRILSLCKTETSENIRPQAEFLAIDMPLDISEDHDAILTETSEPAKSGIDSAVRLIYRNEPPEMMDQIQKALLTSGYETSLSSLHDFNQEPTSIAENVIFVADYDTPLLPSITEPEFTALQHVTDNAGKLLWLTAGGLLDGKLPQYAMASGLLRSLRSERSSLKAITIDFDLVTTSTQDIVDIVSKKTTQLFSAWTSFNLEN
jgi:acyl transferase domain-containing protein